jgi:UTP--glucose-1-phosphate uridylyltransferase
VKKIVLLILCLFTQTYPKLPLKAIIPAAGLGTRFLPFTKCVAKEFVPLLEKPVIHYVIQEAVDAGITDFVFVINKEKQVLVDYFSPDKTLHGMLQKTNKLQYIKPLEDLSNTISITPVFQETPIGLGDAILRAEKEISDDFVAVIFPDNVTFADVPVLTQLSEFVEKYGVTVLGIEEQPREKITAYGMVEVSEEIEPGLFVVKRIIEKPMPEEITSLFSTTGRHIFKTTIFKALKTIKPGRNNEYQLTDAVNALIESGELVYAYLFHGDRFDTGRPDEWIHAVIYCAKQAYGVSW